MALIYGATTHYFDNNMIRPKRSTGIFNPYQKPLIS